MSEIQLVSKNPIVLTIVSGNVKDELLDMLIAKQLPLTDEEYLECLSFVVKNERLKNTALEQLKDIPEFTKVNYIEKTAANHRVAYFILLEALNKENEKIVSRIIRNQALPPEFLVKIAQKGNISMLEMLLDNQIKLIAYPEIMEMMESNSHINNFIRGKIKEVRDFYLNENQAEPIPVEAVIDDLKLIMAAKDNESEPGETGAESDEMEILTEEEDDKSDLHIEEKALTILQEINRMSVSERIKLALSGSKTHRMILIKDANKMVSLAVVESPKISQDEVLLLSRNRSLPMEIIAKISRNRDWVKNYTIMLELVQNPKTPINSALEFIKKLHIRDLKLVTSNKNISPVIRQLAVNYFAQKEKNK